MEILYQDNALWVLQKPLELVSEQTPDQSGLADLLAAQNRGYVGVVHRLDRGVGGVMVYAKTPRAAATLSAQVQSRALKKEYLAVVEGVPDAPTGQLRDLLFHDRRINKTFVVERERKGVKEALLDYELLQTLTTEAFGTISLLRVRLHTGRTHQIRAQFAHRKLPLLGDRKYGARNTHTIGLFSHRLTFLHPLNGREVRFSALPTGAPWECFSTLPPQEKDVHD
ncbi:MAG: RluA family pseudouridine synthase [Clostridia bacterium]|nr:RluA family pseudouridine synthase [Clostridia bacterium]